jgi:hypothetical protein
MKKFYPTYLYIKTHNKTGLKYFGKTTNNPYRYNGSGKHWLAHIKKHGNDISTEILGYYTSLEECKNAALTFSKDNKIVESLSWANMINENGIDGGATIREYQPMTNDTKEKLSISLSGKVPWNKGMKNATPGNKQPRTQEQKEKISKSLKGKSRSPESIEKGRQSNIGRIVSEETRLKISEKKKGYKHSEETIKKLKSKKVSELTKEKIREARKSQVFTEETKKKLSGTVLVVDKSGSLYKIPKDQYYSQTGSKEQWEWVSHKSKEAKMRR